mmetsp:Transcript_1793/g.5667  ORF Transcript_1793/g.5667 Transcript_1793/m.5667 type:complete len:238 (-) Transcript_1793:8-721(-)
MDPQHRHRRKGRLSTQPGGSETKASGPGLQSSALLVLSASTTSRQRSRRWFGLVARARRSSWLCTFVGVTRQGCCRRGGNLPKPWAGFGSPVSAPTGDASLPPPSRSRRLVRRCRSTYTYSAMARPASLCNCKSSWPPACISTTGGAAHCSPHSITWSARTASSWARASSHGRPPSCQWRQCGCHAPWRARAHSSSKDLGWDSRSIVQSSSASPLSCIYHFRTRRVSLAGTRMCNDF